MPEDARLEDLGATARQKQLRGALVQAAPGARPAPGAHALPQNDGADGLDGATLPRSQRCGPGAELVLSLQRRVQQRVEKRENLRSWLERWDRGSSTVRKSMLAEFLQRNEGRAGDEVHAHFCQGSSLLLSRFSTWLKLTYLTGTALSLQIRALHLLVRAVSDQGVLDEFLQSGSLITLLEILAMAKDKGVSEGDKLEALRLLGAMCESPQDEAHVKAVDLIVKFHGLDALRTCLSESSRGEVHKQGRRLLVTLYRGGGKAAKVTGKCLKALLQNAEHPHSLRTSCLVVHELLSQLAEPVPALEMEQWSKFIRPMVNLVPCTDAVVQHEACEVLAMFLRVSGLFGTAVAQLLGLLRRLSGLHASSSEGTKAMASGTSYSTAAEPSAAVAVAMPGDVRILSLLDAFVGEAAPDQTSNLCHAGVLLGLVGSMLNIHSYEAQKLAIKVCRQLCAKFSPAKSELDTILGAETSAELMCSTTVLDGGLVRRLIKDEALFKNVSERLKERNWDINDDGMNQPAEDDSLMDDEELATTGTDDGGGVDLTTTLATKGFLTAGAERNGDEDASDIDEIDAEESVLGELMSLHESIGEIDDDDDDDDDDDEDPGDEEGGYEKGQDMMSEPSASSHVSFKEKSKQMSLGKVSSEMSYLKKISKMATRKLQWNGQRETNVSATDTRQFKFPLDAEQVERRRRQRTTPRPPSGQSSKSFRLGMRSVDLYVPAAQPDAAVLGANSVRFVECVWQKKTIISSDDRETLEYVKDLPTGELDSLKFKSRGSEKVDAEVQLLQDIPVKYLPAMGSTRGSQAAATSATEPDSGGTKNETKDKPRLTLEDKRALRQKRAVEIIKEKERRRAKRASSKLSSSLPQDEQQAQEKHETPVAQVPYDALLEIAIKKGQAKLKLGRKLTVSESQNDNRRAHETGEKGGKELREPAGPESKTAPQDKETKARKQSGEPRKHPKKNNKKSKKTQSKDKHKE